MRCLIAVSEGHQAKEISPGWLHADWADQGDLHSPRVCYHLELQAFPSWPGDHKGWL